MRRSAMPRSLRLRRTPCTCPRTSSRAWGTGRSRSPPTPPRRVPRRPATSRTTSCTRWTTWSMPTCNSPRTARPGPPSTRWPQSRATTPTSGRGRLPSRPVKPATWSNAATGPAPPDCARRRAGLPTSTPSRASLARWARRAPATRPPPGRTSRSSPICVTRYARRTTGTGRSRWTSNGRLPAPGCCRPRGSGTRRSAQ